MSSFPYDSSSLPLSSRTAWTEKYFIKIPVHMQGKWPPCKRIDPVSKNHSKSIKGGIQYVPFYTSTIGKHPTYSTVGNWNFKLSMLMWMQWNLLTLQKIIFFPINLLYIHLKKVLFSWTKLWIWYIPEERNALNQ